MVSFRHRKNALKVVTLTFCKVIMKANDTDAKHTWPGEKRNCEAKWVEKHLSPGLMPWASVSSSKQVQNLHWW